MTNYGKIITLPLNTEERNKLNTNVADFIVKYSDVYTF